ncbi:hypothetical protein MKQ70_20105 [Chitinophaga sedimenti]|uniref:hypothetical protein n=1 Tax=Chitinophaga sedimenti TaxID=2033606 RepID=UPI002002EA65|nr:hypothetical protein [Chitinophaga sedimenti]MCK7557182.1 hypothetical protein [Chitinophaga sedimenti]
MQNLNITKWLQFIMAFLMNSFGVTDDVHSFYQLTGRQVAWTGDSCRANLEQLAAYVDQAPYLGLRDQQYEPALLDSLIIEKSYHSDTLLDKRLTRAALLFFSDVVYGQRLRKDVNYNGQRYSPAVTSPWQGCWPTASSNISLVNYYTSWNRATPHTSSSRH